MKVNKRLPILATKVNIIKKVFTRQISTDVYPLWRKWGLSKLKEGKQMFTLKVNKRLFPKLVNKQGGICNIPLFTQGVYWCY